MTGTAIDRRSLGRRLTILTDASVADVLAVRGDEPLLRESSAHRVGFTGPPGAGKSTLIGALARRRIERARPVGIVWVDPTTPTTGGSTLGDRIRIDGAVEHGDLFVRSVPSRSSEDGLSDNLPDLMAALAEQPYDELGLETVGVSEIVAELDPYRTDVAGAYRFVLERLGAMQRISTERKST